MSDGDHVNARIDALEMRVAYQDQVIEDLNQAIIDQWKQIDGLKRQLAEILDRVQDVEDGSTAAPERPPPHY
ncbi:MAG TPA: SlyX family protein [Microvirga sp.]|nr:SlyX family protein [Microvirga sp.]